MNIVTEGHGSSRRKMDLNVLSRAGTGCSSESQVQALMPQPNNSVDEPKNRTSVLEIGYGQLFFRHVLYGVQALLHPGSTFHIPETYLPATRILSPCQRGAGGCPAAPPLH